MTLAAEVCSREPITLDAESEIFKTCYYIYLFHLNF